ncbi:MAG: hypothetical protein K0Q50_1899 [Vampirovibrio sp.]|jgi:hypothetical protein|nr:hypothetical protein [Vampirovibrio sp.]
MTILIIGSPEEAHSAFIHHKIRQRGHEAIYLDTRAFPSQTRLSMFCGPQQPHLGTLHLPTEPLAVPLEQVEAVYWRYHMGFQWPAGIEGPFLLEMAQREIESALGSLFRMLPCRWVNSPEAIAQHAYKPYQLQLMHQAGIRIPQTLISNDPNAVTEFYERLNGQVIYKPVRGGAHTARLKPEDLKAKRLSELATAPVQFQEYVDGVDVRVYMVKDEVFAGEIHSRTLDFREDPDALIVPIQLPSAIEQDCRIIMRILGLMYTGIDARRTPQGEYVFLEGNPCPMFMHFEQQAGYPISDRLVDLLLNG